MNQVEIEKLDHQGRGIAHIGEKIAFIENALPGEKVNINIIKENKKIIEAVVEKHITKSENRIDSPCPYYSECGGCDLMHLSYQGQLEYKENKVKEIMKRFAGIDEGLIKDIVPCSKQFNYRNKVTLKVKEKMGYYKKKSYDIVSIDKCLIANDKINKAIQILKEIYPPEGINELVIRSINEEDISLTIYLQKQENLDNFCNKLVNVFDSIKIIDNNKAIKTTGKSNIIGRLEKYNFQMSSTAFFQVNTQQTIKLYDKVTDYVRGFSSPTVLDLYCGTGTIGIYVSDYTSKIIGVEVNEKAVKDAIDNAISNNVKNMEFISGDAKDILRKKDFKADLVIVDPPRSGLDISVIEDIKKINPEGIIYVSCDPVTLARDLKIFSDSYNVIEITPFDMFPNTHHVECVSLLKIRL
jgi:23S rRNA (uracil1939-C5)-methyltransferase